MTVRFISNKDISLIDINRIIAIKNEHWPHNYDSQIMWLRQNLYDDDVHLLLSDGLQLLAYLNIVRVNARMDSKTISMIGIGNVCVEKSREHSGMGRLIIGEFNSYVEDMNAIGVLLCKSHLVEFYKKCGWKEIKPNKVSVANVKFQNHIMVYSSDSETLDYLCNAYELEIDRNF